MSKRDDGSQQGWTILSDLHVLGFVRDFLGFLSHGCMPAWYLCMRDVVWQSSLCSTSWGSLLMWRFWVN